MITSHFPSGGNNGGSATSLPPSENITYTGDAIYLDDGDGNWRVKFLSSGTLTLKQDTFVDIFTVGGGGNGDSGHDYSSVSATVLSSGGGGGGGYTKTERNKKLIKGKSYIVTVGAARGKSSLADAEGVAICEAAGGKNGNNPSSSYTKHGGNGGSGGGPGRSYYASTQGKPGSDGSDGTDTISSTYNFGKGGTGQGTTTREFGETTGDLYSGGGGGGYGIGKANAAGASGGGGSGATRTAAAKNGGENTGGGGGGGASYNSKYPVTTSAFTSGGTGGSGIVIIRNFRATMA